MSLFGLYLNIITNYFNVRFNLRHYFLWISALVGIVIGVVIGIIKEKYDSKHGGIFDLEDLLADIAGSASGALIGTIFILLT